MYYIEVIFVNNLVDTAVEMVKVQHMWRIYLQRKEVQQSQGNSGEWNISWTSYFSFLHQMSPLHCRNCFQGEKCAIIV